MRHDGLIKQLVPDAPGVPSVPGNLAGFRVCLGVEASRSSSGFGPLRVPAADPGSVHIILPNYLTVPDDPDDPAL